MTHGYFPVILAAAVITYLTRIAGLRFGKSQLPATVQRFLHYVPIAAFSALIIPGLTSPDADIVPRVAAAVVAIAAVLRFGRLWFCLAVGMSVFWLTRWIM